MGENSTDLQLTKAIKTVHSLRSSVTSVYEKLQNGISETRDPQGREKAFLSDLQQRLVDVNEKLGEVEKFGNSLATPTGQTNLGNSNMLTVDPVLDKSALFSQLNEAYKLDSKMRDHAGWANQMLFQNSLKRSSVPSSLGAKRMRKAFPNYHSMPTQDVDNLIGKITRLYQQEIHIAFSRPIGNPAVLQLTLNNKTMKAIVVLRGLFIEHVIVRGYDEEMHLENGKLDLWSKSKYEVFRKVTDNMCAAMVHFFSPAIADMAIMSFVKWVHTYNNLFAAPCKQCGKILLDNLPPTWRDVRTLGAFHEACRL